MLGLKLPTDPRWVNIVEKNIEEILVDHAYCEQKAASNAISVIVKHPEYPDVVDAMIEIVQEEMEHFGMVHDKIKERGYKLGRERKDKYVGDLMSYMGTNFPGGSRHSLFVNRMLFAAIIEARSCERFRVLSENLKDEKLSNFYSELMASEANHYTIFLGFARKYGNRKQVDDLWNSLLEFEGDIIREFAEPGRIHG